MVIDSKINYCLIPGYQTIRLKIPVISFGRSLLKKHSILAPIESEQLGKKVSFWQDPNKSKRPGMKYESILEPERESRQNTIS